MEPVYKPTTSPRPPDGPCCYGGGTTSLEILYDALAFAAIVALFVVLAYVNYAGQPTI